MTPPEKPAQFRSPRLPQRTEVSRAILVPQKFLSGAIISYTTSTLTPVLCDRIVTKTQSLEREALLEY